MSVANSYARALFEAVIEKGMTNDGLLRIEKELGAFSAIIKSAPTLLSALVGPIATAKEKSNIAHDVAVRAGFSPEVTDFLGLLARKGRISRVEDIRESFLGVALESRGGVLGHLVSAEPLEQRDVEELTRVFAQKLGKNVMFRVATDPTLLAGLKVTVDGVTYDGTLRAQLLRLRDQFVHGNETVH